MGHKSINEKDTFQPCSYVIIHEPAAGISGGCALSFRYYNLNLLCYSADVNLDMEVFNNDRNGNQHQSMVDLIWKLSEIRDYAVGLFPNGWVPVLGVGHQLLVQAIDLALAGK